MIQIVCRKCKGQSSPYPVEGKKEGYLEINLNNDTWYYKCPLCMHTNKFKMKDNPVPLPRIRRQGP